MYSSFNCEKELPTALTSRNTCQMYNKSPPIRKKSRKKIRKETVGRIATIFLVFEHSDNVTKKSIEELPDANKTYHRTDHFIKKRLIRCKFYSVSNIHNKLRGEASLYGTDR